ncbi:MAG: sodium-dependent transporter, partial [Candidatus Methanomethylophilaceae archaeon]|nr:sodium-dependent transporter [Candidatus Methanomethylophilaceae archaeon]
IGIILYELFCVDGVMDGVAFYLDPDLSELSPDTFVAAISQVFFSLSISIGVLVTYGSYISKDVDLERSAVSVVLVDSTVALLAGLMIIPVAFIFGHQDSSGMGLMFTALPQVFQTMPGGNIVAPIFYLMVFFAAITSAASLSEAAVSSISDSRKLSRKKSAGALMAIMLVLGTICVLGFDKGPLFIDGMGETTGWLGIMDSFINILLMPLAAILMCVLIGYVLKTRFIEEEITVSSKFRLKPMFKVMVMVIAPVFLAIILIVGVIGLVT